ncbi:MAG: hypothetical protein HQK51_21670, partial [Oligoflexia bacterium]|nr:hypothetical protein [Oligoflexia bacterium]
MSVSVEKLLDFYNKLSSLEKDICHLSAVASTADLVVYQSRLFQFIKQMGVTHSTHNNEVIKFDILTLTKIIQKLKSQKLIINYFSLNSKIRHLVILDALQSHLKYNFLRHFGFDKR